MVIVVQNILLTVTVMSALPPSPAVLYGMHCHTPSWSLTVASSAPIFITPSVPPATSTPSLVHLNVAAGIPGSVNVQVKSVLGLAPSISGPMLAAVATASPGRPVMVD